MMYGVNLPGEHAFHSTAHTKIIDIAKYIFSMVKIMAILFIIRIIVGFA
jgi:hypothetical protein